jgi:putative membrane protein
MPHSHATWATSFVLAVAAAALVSVYALGLIRLRARSNALPAWRSGAFVLGLATVWLAAGSSVASGDAGSLTGHMVQHLLLMTIAPPLVLLGDPIRVLSSPMSSRSQAATVRAFRRSGSIEAAVAFWLAASGTLVLWHMPAAFALALRSPVWHAVEQASFLATGLLFWLPVVEPWPVRTLPPWSVVLYLFMATLPCDVLGAFLVFSDRVAYPFYLSGASEAAVLSDQERAGALMWTCVTLVYLVAGTLASARMLTDVDRLPHRRMRARRAAGTAPRPTVRTARQS